MFDSGIGSDQWGNIVTGTELIRRMDGGTAFAITTPLIQKADGTKFGKTEEGNVWLDPKKTSPYKFYQYWINSSDEDAKNYIKIFTLKTKDQIDELIKEHDINPGLRLLQKELAKSITIMVHGEENFVAAQEASTILFKKGDEAVKSLETLKKDLSDYKINLEIVKGDELEIFSKLNKKDKISIYNKDRKMACNF